MDRTAGFRAKYRRGREHLKELKEAVDTFVQPSRYGLLPDLHLDIGKCVVYAQVFEDERITDWGVLIGDVVHNFRSSLEHLAYALACLKHDPPTEKTTFPIFWEPKEADVRARLRPLLPEDAKRIVALQPYNRSKADPRSDPLWMLHALWNLDKHELCAATIVPVTITRVTYETRDLDVIGGGLVSGELKPGAVVASYDVRQIGDDPDMDVYGEGTVNVLFDEGTPAAQHRLVKTLTLIADDVQRILLSFISRFH